MQRNQTLDGVRGFAILAIIFYHLMPTGLPGGFVWVNIFFVFSGYFFARSLERLETLEARQWFNRLGKSLRRLFVPMLWFLVILVIFCLLFAPQELRYLRADLWSSLTFTNNWHQLLADRSYFAQMTDVSPLTHLWYNALLVQMMLLSSGVIYLTRRRNLTRESKLLVWLIIVAVSQGMTWFVYQPDADPSRVYYSLDTRWFAYGIGIIAYYIKPWVEDWLDSFNRTYEIVSLAGALVFALLMGATLFANDLSPASYYVWLPLVSWLGLYLLFTSLYDALTLKFVFSRRLLAQLGQRSYSFYLWYYPVITFYARHLRWFQDRPWTYVVISFATIVAVSLVFYALFEARDPLPSTEQLKDLWQNRRVNGQLVAITLVFGLFFYGLLTSDSAKRPAIFANEYQEYRLKTNVQGRLHPAEAPIHEVMQTKERLNRWLGADQVAIKEIENTYTFRVSLEDSTFEPIEGELAEAIATYREWYPDVSQALSDDEIRFAMETPATFFGDSLTLLNGWYFSEVMPESQSFGYKSLQIWEGVDILAELFAEGEIFGPLIVNLGTNGSLDQPALEQLVEMVDDRPLYLVNTNSAVMHKEEVNELLDWAQDHYDHVTVLDWAAIAEGHPEYYDLDDIHLSIDGMGQQAIMVIQQLYQDKND